MLYVVVCCVLFDVCCLLCIACSWLRVACRVLLAVCSLLIGVCSGLLPDVCSLFFLMFCCGVLCVLRYPF